MKKFIKVISLVLVAISIFAIAAPALAVVDDYYVNCEPGETVRLRKTASSSGTILTNIPFGTIVRAEPYDSSWHKVWYGSYTGYMMSSFLALVKGGGSTGSHPQTQSAAFGSANLYKGCTSGKYVKNLQLCLAWEGYISVLDVDGIFGPNTDAAVRDYQSDYGLAVDGIVGSGTKASLWNRHSFDLQTKGYN